MLEQLAQIIRESLNRDPGEITESTALEDLGINSLELLEILMAIEERYDISIEVDAIEARETLLTVGDLLKLGRTHGLGTA